MAGYDISLLIGQSNTAGRGEPFSLTTDPINPMIWQYGAKGRAIVPASEPLDMNEATTRGIGPGLQWARHYVSKGRNNDRPVLLVPAARGGTPLVSSTGTTWNPNTTGSLLDQALQQLDEAIAAAGPGSRVVTALWIQGETDGDQSRTRAQYQALLDQLIAKVRTHVGDDRLPFIVGGMVPMYLTTGTRAQIDQAHRDTPRRVDMTAFSEAPPEEQYSDLDGNHFNAAGQRVIGLRMFDAWEFLVPPGPRPGGGVMTDIYTGTLTDVGVNSLGELTPELTVRPEVEAWGPTGVVSDHRVVVEVHGKNFSMELIPSSQLSAPGKAGVKYVLEVSLFAPTSGGGPAMVWHAEWTFTARLHGGPITEMGDVPALGFYAGPPWPLPPRPGAYFDIPSGDLGMYQIGV